MKITNLIALPFGLVADAVTLGQAGVTRRIFNQESEEKCVEVIRAITESPNNVKK
jgi:hypothetical protein